MHKILILYIILRVCNSYILNQPQSAFAYNGDNYVINCTSNKNTEITINFYRTISNLSTPQQKLNVNSIIADPSYAGIYGCSDNTGIIEYAVLVVLLDNPTIYINRENNICCIIEYSGVIDPLLKIYNSASMRFNITRDNITLTENPYIYRKEICMKIVKKSIDIIYWCELTPNINLYITNRDLNWKNVNQISISNEILIGNIYDTSKNLILSMIILILCVTIILIYNITRGIIRLSKR